MPLQSCNSPQLPTARLQKLSVEMGTLSLIAVDVEDRECWFHRTYRYPTNSLPFCFSWRPPFTFFCILSLFTFCTLDAFVSSVKGQTGRTGRSVT
jgi:hypothetical protein